MIALSHIDKHYRLGEQTVPVLRDLSLAIATGEFVSIMGASGAGKSTLLNIIGCLDRPSSGTYQLDGENVNSYTDDQLAQVRNQRIGFVFQLFSLIPKLSAYRNVELPLVYAGVDAKQRDQMTQRALQHMQLQDRADHTPAQLSGGQQQRVAIARALVNTPGLLVLDEPTGSLDSDTSRTIMGILRRIHEQGTTLVMVTHDNHVAQHSSRVLTMRDGRIVNDQRTQASAAT